MKRARNGCHQQSGFKWNSHYYFQSLRQQVLLIAHDGHFGIVATKLRLRTKIGWPGIDKDAEQCVRSCHGCQLVGQATPPKPLTPNELPLGK